MSGGRPDAPSGPTAPAAPFTSTAFATSAGTAAEAARAIVMPSVLGCRCARGMLVRLPRLPHVAKERRDLVLYLLHCTQELIAAARRNHLLHKGVALCSACQHPARPAPLLCTETLHRCRVSLRHRSQSLQNRCSPSRSCGFSWRLLTRPLVAASAATLTALTTAGRGRGGHRRNISRHAIISRPSRRSRKRWRRHGLCKWWHVKQANVIDDGTHGQLQGRAATKAEVLLPGRPGLEPQYSCSTHAHAVLRLIRFASLVYGDAVDSVAWASFAETQLGSLGLPPHDLIFSDGLHTYAAVMKEQEKLTQLGMLQPPVRWREFTIV